MIAEYTTVLQFRETVAKDTVVFRFSKPKDWNFVVGQFISLKFTETAFRAYSIASIPLDDFIELVVRLIPGGVGSEALRVAKIGQEFVFRGAFGMFTLSDTKSVPQVFCATGTGIAPFRAMILTELQKENPRPMHLLYGGRNVLDLAYLDELSNLTGVQCWIGLSQEADVEVLNALNSGGNVAEKCRITEFLKQPVFEKTSEYYICGNGDMVLGVREVLLEKSVDAKQIHQERFN